MSKNSGPTITPELQRSLFKRSLAGWFVICLSFAIFGSLLERMDNSVYSYFTRSQLRGRDQGAAARLHEKYGREIVLLSIDEASLDSLELTWPLPRKLYSDIVHRLDKLGAKSIAFDVMFTEPSGSKIDDQALAEAFQNPKVVATYPLNIDSTGLSPGLPHEAFIKDWTESDLESRLGFTADWKVDEHGLFVPLELGGSRWALAPTLLAHYREQSAKELLDSVDLDTRKLEFAGFSETSRGGIVRFQAFGLPTEAAVDKGRVTLGDVVQVIPLDALMDLEEADLQPGLLESEEFMAIIGVTSRAGFDEKETLIGTMSGVGIHCNILCNLMGNDFVRRPSLFFDRFLLLLLGLVMATAGSRLGYKAFAGLSFFLLAAVWLFGRAAVIGGLGGSIWPSFWAPTILLVGMTSYIAVLRQQAARSELSKLMYIMQEVCPAADMEKVLAEGGLKPGGEKRNLTILFSDLRNYTTFVESQPDAVAVLEFLNTYYGSVSHIVQKYGGVVLDYQGDAQMIVFGLKPESQPNHAAAAIKAGAEIILTLDELRQEGPVNDIEVPDTGVGICTGDVSFGVLGNARRKQYVAIGDTTNVAARLQGKSEVLGVRVLAGKSSMEAAGDEVILRYVDEVPLKGKSGELSVYCAEIQKMADEKMITLPTSS